MKFSSIILAGGKSSRMKMNKALLPVKNKTFIEIIAGQLEKSFDEVIIITNNPEEYEFLPYKKYMDILPNKGPLGGIHSGLTYANYQYSFVTACDMPFIDGMAARKLCDMVSGYDGIVPKKGEFLQPLFAVYSKDCIPSIEKCIKEEEFKIISFYPYVNIRYTDWSYFFTTEEASKTFFNVNTPEDLNTLKNF